jgi:hypothetical protein
LVGETAELMVARSIGALAERLADTMAVVMGRPKVVRSAGPTGEVKADRWVAWLALQKEARTAGSSVAHSVGTKAEDWAAQWAERMAAV